MVPTAPQLEKAKMHNTHYNLKVSSTISFYKWIQYNRWNRFSLPRDPVYFSYSLVAGILLEEWTPSR
jgi:hypothetical protein